MKLTNAFVAVFLALTWSHAVTVQAQVMDDNLGGDSFFLEGGANGAIGWHTPLLYKVLALH